MKIWLTKKELDALARVRRGGDVTSYDLARTLRAIEQKCLKADALPLVDIGPVMGDYDGAGQMPFFGAITTRSGNRALTAAGL